MIIYIHPSNESALYCPYSCVRTRIIISQKHFKKLEQNIKKKMMSQSYLCDVNILCVDEYILLQDYQKQYDAV